MDGMKNWYQSAAVWGGLVAVASGAAGVFGVAISADDQAALASGLAQAAALAGSLASLGGGGVAIWGRIRATKTIIHPPAAGAAK